MANEVLDGANMIGELLGKGKRFYDQTRYSLSQRAVESFLVIGYPLLLFDDPMLLLWNDTFVCTPPVCIKGRMSPVAFWY